MKKRDLIIGALILMIFIISIIISQTNIVYADNGIGAATALAVLESKDIEHGPIEALFTLDEETGEYKA